MVRIFRHYIPKSLLLLGIFEVFILLLSLYIASVLRFQEADSINQHVNGGQAIIYLFVMISVMTAMGLYQRDVQEPFGNLTMRVGGSVLIGFGSMYFLFYLFPELFVDQLVIIAAGASSFLGLLGSRYLYFRYADQSFLKRRALVLGAGERALKIERLMAAGKLDGINILGFVHISREPVEISSGKVLGNCALLSTLVDNHDIDEIIVAIDDRRKAFPTEQLLDIKMGGIEVVEDIAFWEKQTGKIEIDSLHPSHLIFADGYAQTVVKPVSKRVFDILVSSTILILALPIMIITALAIWLESKCRGSIFYLQTRVGAGGRDFSIMKFRSMTENAETDGAQWAVENDPRVTKVGRFIRKTRIDELPQLINVLRGNMSFVGPRPERPEFVDELSKKIPYYSLRHGMKPGITGWAQVMFPYGASEEDARQKLQYDLYYMKNYTVFLDLMIIFQTLQVVIWQKGGR